MHMPSIAMDSIRSVGRRREGDAAETCLLPSPSFHHSDCFDDKTSASSHSHQHHHDPQSQFSSPLPQSIDYAQLYSLLSEYSAHNSGSLIIPTSHPTSHRIADVLLSTCVDRVIDARWNALLNKVVALRQQCGLEATAITTTTTTQYAKSSSDHSGDVNGYDEEYDIPYTLLTNWFHEQRAQYHRYQQDLPNSLSSNQVQQLQTMLPQFFPSKKSISTSSSTGTNDNNYCSLTISNHNNTANTNATELAIASASSLHHSINNGTKWEARLHELIHYRSLHGHTNVPLDHPTLLGIWVKNQRDTYHYEPSSMPSSRIAALDAIQFDWNRWGHQRLRVRQDAWDAMYNKLVEYMKKHGHGNVSQHAGKKRKRKRTKKETTTTSGGVEDECCDGDEDNLEEEERLGKWIKNQRYEYRKYHVKGLGPSRLGRDRIEKLNAIGFQWRLRPERVPWEDRFHALVEFRRTYGHCRVPMSIPDLGKWAKYQRDQYILYLRGKPSKMTPSKIDMLTSIGFEDSIDDRALAAASSELLTNDDDTFGGGVDDGVGGTQVKRRKGYEEDEEDGGDEEEQGGESEYTIRLDDAVICHQRQNLDSYHLLFDAPPQQQYPLSGGIGDLTYSTCGDDGGGSAQHLTQQSGLHVPFHQPQDEREVQYSA